jgi:hypothetical protein
VVTAAAAAAAADSNDSSTASDAPDAAAVVVVAAAEAAEGAIEDPEGDSSSSESSLSSQLSSSAVGEAGTYSRMLPKGWGPRLGVGFSRYPRSRNNIVSSASLGVSPKPASAAAGDALSGAAEEVV